MKRTIERIDLPAEFTAVMETFSATAGNRRDYCIQTRLGSLQATFHSEPAGAWIAAVWDDVALVAKHFGVTSILSGDRLNPCSGKWNWHWQEFWPQGLKASAADRRLAAYKMIHAFAAAVAELLPDQERKD